MENNPFIYTNKPLKKVPHELKSEIMSDVIMIKSFMELSNLFSYKIGNVSDTPDKKKA